VLNACCFASVSSPSKRSLPSGPKGQDSREAIFVFYCPLCLWCIHRLPATFAMIPTVRRTQQARSPVVTYSATGACRSRRNTRHFRSSAFARISTSTDVFPYADRACARYVERSSRAPMSRNSGRPTLWTVEPKYLFAARFRPHRARRPVGLSDGTL